MNKLNNAKIVTVGGSKEQHQQVLERFAEFWEANDTLDIPALERLWSDDNDLPYFNSNGFNYIGLADWLGVWRYYKPRFALREAAALGFVRCTIEEDLAVVTDEHLHRTYEAASDTAGPPIAGHPWIRVTMVYRHVREAWLVTHAHFSTASAPRLD